MKVKQKKSKSSIVLYVAASIIVFFGTVLLISNIMLFHNNVIQYVAKGNSVSVVTAQLIPTQLIPGILGPICTYWGIALLLIGAALLNEKVTIWLSIQNKKDRV